MDSARVSRLIPRTIRQSLRYRLLAFLLLSMILLMSITVFVGQRTANHEFGEILDGQMITTGRALFAIIVLELREGDESTIPALLDEFVRLRRGLGDWQGEHHDVEVYDNEFYFQLVDPSGNTLFASRQPALVQNTRTSPGLFKIGSGDDQWHLFGLSDAQTGYTFYTGQSQSLRHELSSESIEYILLPFVLVTIVILGAIWVGTRYGLKPLIQVTGELDSRSPEMLDTIDVEDKATELRPMLVALNRLFARVSTSLATERQFSADASHELRTPLAGIKANLDAARILSSEPEQEKYLNNIESCVDNATRITEGLLLLSRLQSAGLDAFQDSKQFDVHDSVRREIGKRVSAHPSWQDRIQLHDKTQGTNFLFKGPENLVEIAIGNVIENALKYSTESVEVAISEAAVDSVVISIMDHGPGIPDNAQNLIYQRFYRVDTDTTKGFGLGLALVQQIMKVLNGHIHLSNRSPRGLNATLTFPRGSARSIHEKPDSALVDP